MKKQQEVCEPSGDAGLGASRAKAEAHGTAKPLSHGDLARMRIERNRAARHARAAIARFILPQ